MRNKYIVQLLIGNYYVDEKEYKIKDYAIKYCRKRNNSFNHLRFRVIEVVYEEI